MAEFANGFRGMFAALYEKECRHHARTPKPNLTVNENPRI